MCKTGDLRLFCGDFVSKNGFWEPKMDTFARKSQKQATFRTTIWRSNQLNYGHHVNDHCITFDFRLWMLRLCLFERTQWLLQLHPFSFAGAKVCILSETAKLLPHFFTFFYISRSMVVNLLDGLSRFTLVSILALKCGQRFSGILMGSILYASCKRKNPWPRRRQWSASDCPWSTPRCPSAWQSRQSIQRVRWLWQPG